MSSLANQEVSEIEMAEEEEYREELILKIPGQEVENWTEEEQEEIQLLANSTAAFMLTKEYMVW